MLNPFRLSKNGRLSIENGKIEIRMGVVLHIIDEVQRVRKVYSKGGIEPWLKICYIRRSRNRTVFICSREYFGLGNLIGNALSILQNEIESCIPT